MTAPPIDVLVAGAGAAGLFCAATAAARGLRTVLLEKQPRPGLKILISGGGRCNVTTTRSGSDLESQYGKARGRFLRHALHVLPPTAVREHFAALGVPLVEEDLEKLFPASQRARDVLTALLHDAEQKGVDLRLSCGVRAVERTEIGFAVQTDQGPMVARRLVIATGGLSYPKTGATGDGYLLAQAFGHTITSTFAALAPLRVDEGWVKALQGIVLHGVEISVLDENSRIVRTRNRPILFTHKGLSGPAPMDLAGDIEERSGAFVRLDFAPGVAAHELEARWLLLARDHGRRQVASLLPETMPERVRDAVVGQCGAESLTLANLGRETRMRLLASVKDLRLRAPSSLGYDHAEVTRGGVALDEVDPRTMQSRRQPGLFFCGEVLDVDGPIGGFNFQAAFATGCVAGRNV